MKASTKHIMLGLGATGVAGIGAALAVRYFRAKKFERNLDAVLTDLEDLEEPVIVSDEIIVVTEAGPYEVDMELVPQEGFEPDDGRAQK